MSLMKRQMEMDFSRVRRHASGASIAPSAKRQSFDRLNESGTFYERQEHVLAFLREHGTATQQEFAKARHLPINCVTAPFRELEEMHKIMKCGKKKNAETGYNNTLYRIV